MKKTLPHFQFMFKYEPAEFLGKISGSTPAYKNQSVPAIVHEYLQNNLSSSHVINSFMLGVWCFYRAYELRRQGGS